MTQEFGSSPHNDKHQPTGAVWTSESFSGAAAINRFAINEVRQKIIDGDLSGAQETLLVISRTFDKSNSAAGIEVRSSVLSLSSEVARRQGQFDRACVLSSKALALLEETANDSQYNRMGRQAKLPWIGFEKAVEATLQEYLAAHIAAARFEPVRETWNRNAPWLLERGVSATRLNELSRDAKSVHGLQEDNRELTKLIDAFCGFQKEPVEVAVKLTSLIEKWIADRSDGPSVVPQKMLDLALKTRAFATIEGLNRGVDIGLLNVAFDEWFKRGSPSSDKEYIPVLLALARAADQAYPVDATNFPGSLCRKATLEQQRFFNFIAAFAATGIDALLNRGDRRGVGVVANWAADFMGANFNSVSVEAGKTLLYAADAYLHDGSIGKGRSRAQQAATAFGLLDRENSSTVIGSALANLRMGFACQKAMVSTPLVAQMFRELGVSEGSTETRHVIPGHILIRIENELNQFLLFAALDEQEAEVCNGALHHSAFKTITNVALVEARREFTKEERRAHIDARAQFLSPSSNARNEASEAMDRAFLKEDKIELGFQAMLPELLAKLKDLEGEKPKAHAPVRRVYDDPETFALRLLRMYRNAAARFYSESNKALSELAPHGFKEERTFIHSAYQALKDPAMKTSELEFPWFKVDPVKAAAN